MKKIILILITSSICASSGIAQQFPLQSQYIYNYASINPAAVGENNHASIRASARNQWVNFGENDISTEYLTFTNSFGNSGVGFTFLNDETGGYYNTTGLKLGYSHKVIVAESEFHFGSHKISIPRSELFFGLSGGATKYNRLNAVNDPVVTNNGDSPLSPEATFGMYYKVNNLNIGISVPGILNSNIDISGSNSNVLESHFYTMLSYTKSLNDFWSLYPSVLMKTAKHYNQFDFNLNVKFRDQVWFGASFRQDFGPSVFVGLDFGRLFSIYSHDISSNKMSNYSNGSHEMTIGYDFRRLSEEELNARKKKKEQEIIDSDNDGVVDSLDLCPHIAGNPEANGCPDFDMDGVPDQYDLCPHLAGNVEAGCPDLTDKEKEIIADVLDNLEFTVNNDKIKNSSVRSLSKLAVMLQQNPSMFLEIHGHASSEGTVEHNLNLSARRSHSVEQFFLSRGISSNKLLIKFYGERSPIFNNNSEVGRAKNRRVELKIRFHLNNKEEVNNIENAYSEALRNSNISSAESNAIEVPVNDHGLNIIQNEDEIIITKEVEREVINIPNVIIAEEEIEDTPIPDEIIEEEPVVEIQEESVIEDAGDSDYLLVVLVLSNKTNTLAYINKSEEDLAYKEIKGKYYIYVYSSSYKEDVIQFKSVYKKPSWIKNPY